MGKKGKLFLLGLFASLLLVACSPPKDFKLPLLGKEPVEEEQTENEELEGGNIGEDSKIEKEKAISQETFDAVEEDFKVAKKEIKEKDKEIDELAKELDFYKKHVRKMTANLEQDELDVLIQNEWSYSLTVNGVSYPKDGILELPSAKEAEIVLTEERVPYSILFESESLSGRLEGFNKGNIRIKGVSPTSVSKDEERGMTIVYKLTDLSPGESFEIGIDPKLIKELGIDVEDLTLTVN